MAQNDDPNQDQQNENPNSDQPTREGRSDRSPDSQQQSEGNVSRPDQGADLDDVDEMDDEDRDDDQRADGGSNRRRSIS